MTALGTTLGTTSGTTLGTTSGITLGTAIAAGQSCLTEQKICFQARTASSLAWGKGGFLFQGDVQGSIQEAQLTIHAEQLELRRATANKEIRLRFEENIQLVGEKPLIRLQAAWLEVQLYANGQLKDFRAGGGVILNQPVTVIQAQELYAGNKLDTIVLQGNVRVKRGSSAVITGERLSIKLGQQGAISISQSQRPVKIDLGAISSAKIYRLSGDTLRNLAQNKLPARVAFELSPIVGTSYPHLAAFTDAVRELITPYQALQYMDILEQAASF